MKHKSIISGVIFTLVFLLLSYMHQSPDGNMHVVFCDVGQGDGVYIKLPDGKDMIIDGGPNSDILTCIGSHMAFWDRRIELVVLTHPQYDHYRGLIDVLERYDVELLLLPPVDNEAKSYQTFKDLIAETETRIHNPYVGERIELGHDVYFSIVWPSLALVTDNIPTSISSNQLLEQRVLGITTTHDDLNDFSIVGVLDYKSFEVLLTGDAEAEILETIFAMPRTASTLSEHIEIYKIGHHGATAGLSQSIAEHINPSLSIISVGEGNRYDHPRKEVLDILDSLEIPYRRTDRDGEIHIVSDGESWWVE